jgi:predicted dehydrogenase
LKKSRRAFLKDVGVAAGGAAAFPTLIPSSVLGADAPSKRITLGFIGMGAQGTQVNLKMFLNEADAQVLAVCDAYRSRAESAANMVNQRTGNLDCRPFQDFRKIIEDPSIDAVVISTPDHWHVPISMMALKAGKDVFSEKPTYCIEEGADLIKEVEMREAVFQAGVEDRSLIHYHKMVEWAKNGALGKLGRIEVTLPTGFNQPKETPVEPPADLDWNLWLGPAPFHAFSPHRTGPLHWRHIRDYSWGHITDWGTHLIDTAQIAVNAPEVCPVEVEGTGMVPEGAMTDTPVSFDLTYRYANGVELHVKDGGTGIRIEGDKGWVRREKWGSGLEASDPAILRTKYTPETTTHWPLPPREQRNFLDCVKSRTPTTYTARSLHQMSTTCHMGVLSILLERKLNWDAEQQVFTNDDEANRLCKRPPSRNWEGGTRSA